MTWMEALRALLAGKKIKHKSWDCGYWILHRHNPYAIASLYYGDNESSWFEDNPTENDLKDMLSDEWEVIE